MAIVSSEESAIVHARAAKLKIDDVFAGAADKRAALDVLCARHGVAYDEVAFVGDDLNDLPALRCVGLPCAVADAARAVKEVAVLVARRRGGEGAVREVCEAIIAAKTETLEDDAALMALAD